jgi:EAL domain-containing protein (putative c-di-GMP-specific phosphodiesterase class I)
MGLKIIAEYVENDAIIEALKKVGVHYAQGYAIEKPHPIEDLNPR